MLNIHDIHRIFKHYNYVLYEQPYRLNLIGFRTKHLKSNQFDDFLFVVYKNPYRYWIVQQYEFTTDPGESMLRKPMNSRGTAILVPGQYVGAYKIDLHKGQRPAICQRLGPVKVYRDDNRNPWIDMDPSTIMMGYFGINLHDSEQEAELVNDWSGGCQVMKRDTDYEAMMYMAYMHEDLYKNEFTYTLLYEQELVDLKLL